MLLILGFDGDRHGKNSQICSETTWFTRGKTIIGGNNAGSALNQLYQPKDMFVDDENAMYIADSLNHRIVKWENNAVEGRVVAGGNGKGNKTNQLNYPTALYVDKQKNIYVVDSGNNRIQKWSANGTNGETLIDQLSRDTRLYQINNDWDLHIDEKRNIYVADRSNNRITKWPPKVQSLRRDFVEKHQYRWVMGYRSAPHGQIVVQTDTPTGVYVNDTTGDIYVASKTPNLIKQFASNGSFIGSVGENLIRGFHGIFTTEKQLLEKFYVFIMDKERYRTLLMHFGDKRNIQVIVSARNLSRDNRNLFDKSVKIQFDSQGNLLALDSDDHRVKKFSVDETLCDTVYSMLYESEYSTPRSRYKYSGSSYSNGQGSHQNTYDDVSPPKGRESPISDIFFPDPTFGESAPRFSDADAGPIVFTNLRRPPIDSSFDMPKPSYSGFKVGRRKG